MKNNGYSITKNIQTEFFAGQIWGKSSSLISSLLQGESNAGRKLQSNGNY